MLIFSLLLNMIELKFEGLSHSVHLGFRLLPFRLARAVLQQSAPGIQGVFVRLRIVLLGYLHAAQGYKQIGVAIGIERSGKPTIIIARCRLVVHYKVACRRLWHTAYGWCRMEGIEQVAHVRRVVKTEADVRPKMHQVAGS